jgi:protein-L-isoaspartate(D-aspartate) O-methyltransferase
MAQEAAQLDHLAIDRARMVERQIARRGVSDARVLDAMRQAPREAFVAPGFEEFAYEDSPLPIAEGQTISQPYIVALMIEAAEVKPGDWVLEVGTGSGYAAAVLSRIAAKVYTVERHGALAEAAKRRFARLGYRNIEVRHGDGTLGWPEVAPFDAIIVTAGGPEIPETLRNQLKVDGRLVIPIGVLADEQRLVKVVRDGEHAFHEEDLGAVRFVPLIGEQGWSERAPDESRARSRWNYERPRGRGRRPACCGRLASAWPISTTRLSADCSIGLATPASCCWEKRPMAHRNSIARGPPSHAGSSSGMASPSLRSRWTGRMPPGRPLRSSQGAERGHSAGIPPLPDLDVAQCRGS